MSTSGRAIDLDHARFLVGVAHHDRPDLQRGTEPGLDRSRVVRE